MLDRVFVYGTLKVGHCRWPHLEPHVVGGPAGVEPATTTGRLFDTGWDYPAACFDLPGTIHGQLALLRTEALTTALALLDEIEGGVKGDYRRVVVRTHGGTEAWAYKYGRSPAGLPDLGGRWTGV